MNKRYGIIGILLLIVATIAWAGQHKQIPLSERTDLPTYTISLIEKGRHKWATVSRQPPSTMQGSNIVTVAEGDEGDYRLIMLSPERDLYVHKNR